MSQGRVRGGGGGGSCRGVTRCNSRNAVQLVLDQFTIYSEAQWHLLPCTISHSCCCYPCTTLVPPFYHPSTMIAATVAALQLSLPVKATRGAFHPATLVSLLKDLHTDQCSTADAELDAVHIDKGFKQGYVAAVDLCASLPDISLAADWTCYSKCRQYLAPGPGDQVQAGKVAKTAAGTSHLPGKPWCCPS